MKHAKNYHKVLESNENKEIKDNVRDIAMGITLKEKKLRHLNCTIFMRWR